MSRLASVVAGLLLASPLTAADTPDVPKAVQLVLDRTNEFRKGEKREPVKVNPELTKTAEYFANFMAENDKYGHEADGSTPAERAKKHGYDYCLVLENIAWQSNSDGFTTESLGGGFVKGWQESPPHRKNMLDPDVTETGVAIALSEKSGRYYAVQMFGRPKSLAIEFKITNRSDVKLEYTIGGDKYTLDPKVIQTHGQCRPGEVTFQTPKGLDPIKFAAGDRFVVSGKDGKYEVKKE
jgi:uncharacterized protein YkwD